MIRLAAWALSTGADLVWRIVSHPCDLKWVEHR